MNEMDTLRDLVKFNTIKDKDNQGILTYIENYLKTLGIFLEKKEKYLIMSIGKEPILGFIGHSDTVNYIEGWSTNPFDVTVKDDNIYGLGVCDMKGGIAAFLQALAEIDLNTLKRGIKVYITYDEEIAFSGIKEILKSHEQFPEYIIVGEPTDNQIITGCKGLLAVRIKTKGKKVHSSTPDKGKSANLEMIKLLNELQNFYEKEIKIERNDNYEVNYTTMNIGLINGGNSINSVSDKCESFIDFRIAKEEHIEKIKQKINELSEKYKADIYYEIEIQPFFNNIDFLENKKTANFMTEASWVKGKRIILGPGPITAHEINEHISIKSLRLLIEQYKGLIEKICNQ
mgnify:CR=1 FL=1